VIDPHLIDMIMRLRSRGISDNPLLKALELSPRKYFVETDWITRAYDEQSLPISCGQSISPPLTVALMSQMLLAGPDHKLLEIGTGSGYHTAILARMVARVFSVERYKQLITEAEDRLDRLGITNHVIRHGDGRYGWKGQAPFDRIIATCALKSEPQKLLDQLSPGGVLVCVLDEYLMRFTKGEGGFNREQLFPLSLPMVEIGKSKSL